MDSGKIFEQLLKIVKVRGMDIVFKSFKSKSRGLINGNKIGLSIGMTMDEINYTLAHELAHTYLHYDKGNIISLPDNAAYEEQADRAANFLLEVILNIG